MKNKNNGNLDIRQSSWSRTAWWRRTAALFALSAVALLQAVGAQAQTPVLQRGYDPGVTGATLGETTLNTTNVNATTFGKLFSLPVDDVTFAQPLYVPNVLVNGVAHNVLYVATMSDTLYAFDADSGGAPLWTVNLASLVGATAVPIGQFVFSGDKGIVGNLGILSTPVIDLSTNTLYAVACTLEGGTMVYRLHAVDIRTGTTRPNSGVQIGGSFGGSTFQAPFLLQRASLVLSGNQLVMAFGAMELEFAGGYTGWILSYDKASLTQTGIFATATSGNRGAGVWQSGRPLAVDGAGFVYAVTGNAYGAGYDGVNNFSESILKLDPANGLKLVDWFTAGNWSSLDTSDLDLTSSGVMLVPGTSLLADGGKTGDLYVLQTSNLGKFNAKDSQVAQKLNISADEIRGGPVYWPRSAANGGPLMFNWSVNDSIKSWAFNGNTFASSPVTQGTVTSQPYPGGILTLSANGDAAGSAIIWANTEVSGDSENNPPVAGELHAYDATNLASELWNSKQNAARDDFGKFAKFLPPLVMNGKVYMGTWSNQVVVYGLLAGAGGNADFQISASPGSQSVQQGQSTSFTVTVGALNGFGSNVTFSVSGVPNGVTATFTPASVTGSGTSTLQVTASSSAARGGYTLTITGTSGSTSHTATVSLSVVSALAPAVDAQAFANSGSASSSVSVPGVTTGAPNELLLALVAADYLSGTNTTVTGVSGGGLTWTLVQRANTQSGTSEIWRAFAPTQLSNVTVTASLSHAVVSSMYVTSFKGVDTSGTGGSGAIGATAATNSKNGAPTGSLVTTRANSLVLAVGNDFDNAISRTPGAGQAILHQYLTPTGDTYWMQGLAAPVAMAGLTATINDTAPTTDRYNLALVEVRAPASGTVTYSISGNLSPASLTANSTVTLTGAATQTTTADASGNYGFSGLASGTYVVTPNQSGVTFSPAPQTVVISSSSVTGINFTGNGNVTSGLAVDAKVSADNSTASTTIASPMFSTSSDNELLLALVATDYLTGANTTVTGVAGAGLTWTLVARANTRSGTSEIWRAFAPAALAGQTVTATLSQSVEASITVMSFSGVDASGTNGANAVGATATASKASGAPSASLVTTRGGSLVVGVGNDYDNAKARTVGSGQTLVHQFLTSLGDTYWMQMTSAPAGAAGSTVTVNDTAPTGDQFNLAIVEVRAP